MKLWALGGPLKPMPKLIRDLIPADMAARGYSPELAFTAGEERKQLLLKKLVEEAQEVLQSKGDLQELGDVYEVLSALADDLGFGMKAVQNAAKAKRKLFGGFASGILWINDEDDSPSSLAARSAYKAAVEGLRS